MNGASLDDIAWLLTVFTKRVNPLINEEESFLLIGQFLSSGYFDEPTAEHFGDLVAATAYPDAGMGEFH